MDPWSILNYDPVKKPTGVFSAMEFLQNWYAAVVEKIGYLMTTVTADSPVVVILKIQHLFTGLSDAQLKILSKYVTLTKLAPSQPNQHRNKIISNELYILLSGRLEAAGRFKPEAPLGKWSEYGRDEVINLLRLINKDYRITIAQIFEPVTCLVIDLEALQKDRAFKDIRPILLNNTSYYFSERLRHTELILEKTTGIAMKSIENQLIEAKERVLFGSFVVRMIVILCLYTLSLRGLEILEVDLGDSTFVSTSLLIVLSFLVYRTMINTELPLSDFGITTANWKPALLEGIIFAILMFLIILLAKLFLITYIPKFQNLPLFDYEIGVDRFLRVDSWKQLGIVIVYCLFAPVQEFWIRGGLQGSLNRFLTYTSKKRLWMSIILSNLIFVTFHAHFSVVFGVVTFFPGIVWGWLYSRHQTLIGVSVSHMLVGFLVIFVLGVTTIIG